MPPDRPVKPEDQELALKLQELAAIETELAERERELAEIQSSLHAFEAKSAAELDPRYEQLADLHQKIGELLIRIKPSEIIAAGASATAAAAAAAATVANAPKTPKPRKHRQPPPATPKPKRPRPDINDKTELSPADTLKRLYRDVAKTVHPDLAEDDAERQRRHELMARANEAYDAGDEYRLSAILHEWDCSPEAIRGEGSIPDLIRAIRRIYRGKLRLAIVVTEINRLAGTSLFNLKNMSDEAQQYERDLLAEMTARLDSDIADAKQRLAELEKVAPPTEEAKEESPAAIADSAPAAPATTDASRQPS